MKLLTSNISRLLSKSKEYRLFTNLIGGRRAREWYVKSKIRPEPGHRILDIGCGTADILEFLKNIDYTGFDMNMEYINSAKKKYREKARFICERLDEHIIGKKEYLNTYDLVLANGIIHHLPDNEALRLFELAFSVLKANGRLVTVDGCYKEMQSFLAHFFLSLDRGKFIRQARDYEELAKKYFYNVEVGIYDNLLRIPYTHIIMECKKI